ncbi:hypothetical protein ACYOEI_26365, partial [Singulisphaera rosea]
MPHRPLGHRPWSQTVFVLLALAFGCHREPAPTLGPVAGSPNEPNTSEAVKPKAEPLRDEIPSAEMDKVVGEHLRGLGHMERYEYDKAAEAFREVHERAPGWIPGSINLAIAYLNQTGTQAEGAKAGGASP